MIISSQSDSSESSCVQVYKQKLKHVLSEHHNTVSELKMDEVAASSLIQNKHTETELGLRKNAHGLQADLREKQLQNENCIKELKLVRRHQFQKYNNNFYFNKCDGDSEECSACLQKHQVELMELTNEYDRRIRGE